MKSAVSDLARPLLLIAAALAVPIVPFLVFGAALEDRITNWLDAPRSGGIWAVAVIGLLASDILLPVPSSLVCTLAGRVLGLWGGTGAAWCGLTAGAVLAFGLVRLVGRAWARRLSGEGPLSRADALAARWGVLVLVVTRPVPVLAEASVFYLATTRLTWWRFLAAVGLSNLGIVVAYAALGDRVQLPIAVAASIVLPLAAACLARQLWPATA